MQLRKALKFIGPLLFLILPLLLLQEPVRGAIQSNRAFVGLNHQPSILSQATDRTVLAAAEAQLLQAARFRPNPASTQRMLAVVQQAQGAAPSATIATEDLIWWGLQKEKEGDLPAAEFFYQWVTEQEPELGDGWYYLGQVYAAQNLNPRAVNAYLQAAEAPTWKERGASDSYLALGNLYASSEADRARDYYEQALSRDQFGDTAAKAAAHYHLAEILLLNETNPAAALPHYQAALTLTPGDHWARLRLGYTIYWATGELAAAEKEIQAAVQAWPDEKYLQWPYFYLGEIYEDAGMIPEAIAAYEQVLRLDPADIRIQERLAILRSQ
jgi:tetratricopeptide (TPR) repeat protein